MIQNSQSSSLFQNAGQEPGGLSELFASQLDPASGTAASQPEVSGSSTDFLSLLKASQNGVLSSEKKMDPSALNPNEQQASPMGIGQQGLPVTKGGQEFPQELTGKFYQVSSELEKVLSLVLGSGEQAVQSSRTLSFIFSEKNSQSLPELRKAVATNPFLSRAVEADDLSSLMQERFSLQDLSSLFEIDPALREKLMASGVSPQEKISVEDFLQAIQVSPQKLGAEVERIKKALLSTLSPSSGQGLVGKNSVSEKASERARADSSSWGESEAGGKIRSKEESKREKKLASSPEVLNPNLALINSSIQPPAGKFDEKSFGGEEFRDPPLELQNFRTKSSDLNSGVRREDSVALAPDDQEFQVKQDVSDLVYDPSLEDMSVPAEFKKAISDFGASESRPQGGKDTAALDFSPEPVRTSSLREGVSDSESLFSASQGRGDESRSADFVAADLAREEGREFKGFRPARKLSSGNGDLSESEPKSVESAVLDARFTSPYPLTAAEHLKEDVKSKGVVKEQSLSESRQSLLQEAQIMARDGGGTARINLSHAGFGQVNLEVRVDGSQVDVRLHTESPELKEHLQSSLDRLQESMQSENLHLKNFEVTQSSSSSRSSMDFSSHPEQNVFFSSSSSNSFSPESGESKDRSSFEKLGDIEHEIRKLSSKASYKMPYVREYLPTYSQFQVEA